MLLLRMALIYIAYLHLVTAHYKVLSESPTVSYSSQKHTPIFSGAVFLTTLTSLKKSVQARKTRLSAVMNDFTSTEIVDIDPLVLDATPMSRAKTVLVLNTSLEMASQYCFMKGGQLPQPSLASDFDLLKTLLTKSSISGQVMDLKLESSFLIHEQSGSLFDSHPNFISGLQIGTSTASSNAKSIEDFIKEDSTSVLVVAYNNNAWVSGFATSAERVAYSNQLCLVPRRLDTLVINNNLNIKHEVSTLDSLATEYITSLDLFTSLYSASPVKLLVTTSVDSSKQLSMPSWIEDTRLVLSQFNTLSLDIPSVTKLSSLVSQTRELITSLNTEIELFKTGFFSLGHAVCKLETVLTCISPDNSKPWSHLKILPIPANNYKLNYEWD